MNDFLSLLNMSQFFFSRMNIYLKNVRDFRLFGIESDYIEFWGESSLISEFMSVFIDSPYRKLGFSSIF